MFSARRTIERIDAEDHLAISGREDIESSYCAKARCARHDCMAMRSEPIYHHGIADNMVILGKCTSECIRNVEDNPV